MSLKSYDYLLIVDAPVELGIIDPAELKFEKIERTTIYDVYCKYDPE
jgi:hypothetical protein